MSTDQWDPEQIVVIRFTLEDGTQVRTLPMARRIAEHDLASAGWLLCEKHYMGKVVRSAAIEPRSN